MTRSSRLAALLVLALPLVLGVPNASADAGDCPSSGSKTLMLATGEHASGGYGCGYLDRWDEHSISGYATQSWASYPAPGYLYDYYCDHQTGDVGFVKATTNGTGRAQVTYTATNTASSTRHWGVGVIWNTGNPHDGTLPAAGPPPAGSPFAYMKNCGANAAQIPSYVLYQPTIQPPAFTTASPGKATVGTAFSVPFSSSVIGGPALPDGQPVYLQAQGGGGALSWDGCTQDAGQSSCGQVEDPPGSGDLINWPARQGLDGAYGVVVSPDGKNVYASATNDSAISIFSRDTTGALVAAKPTGAPATGDPAGTLTWQGCMADAGSTIGCATTQQGLGGAAGLAVSPDGKNVYVAGVSDSALATFSRNTTTGALTPQGCISSFAATGCTVVAQPLGGANGVAVSADGKSVYLTGGRDSAVSRFDRDPSTGTLSAQGCIADANIGSGCAQTQQGLGGANGVAVSHDGLSVYVAGQSDSAIVRFNRAPATGALTPAGCVADVGNSNCGSSNTQGLNGVTGVAVSPDNRSVYTTSIYDNAVVTFSRDTTSGALGASSCVGTGNPGCPNLGGLTGANRVVVSPDNISVYVTGGTDNAVTRFPRNTASTGTYGALGNGISCLADGGDAAVRAQCPGAPALDGPNGIAVSPDTRSVYVANYNDDSVVQLDPWTTVCCKPAVTTSNGAGTLTFTPSNAVSYVLRIAYPGLNVASPNRGYTPAISPTFPVTAKAASAASAARSASAVPAPAPAPSGRKHTVLDRVLETQMAGFGDLAIVNSQFTVPKSGRIKSSLSSLGCPKRFALLHVEAASVGKGAPDDGVTVGRSQSGGVKLNIAGDARGHGAQAQLMCRRSSARRVVRKVGFAYGTIKGDTIVVALPRKNVYGGLGADRLTVAGARSSAFGGLGDDSITLRARGNASGGPGDDILRSTSPGLTLLWGGLGKDRLISSRGPTLINALDGNGGDTVRCGSDKTRVLSDPGDTLVGPCKKVGLR